MTTTEKIQENKEVSQTPKVEKDVDSSLTTQDSKTDETILNKDVVLTQEEKEEKEKAKQETQELFEEQKLKDLKTVDDVQKATDKYGTIMDKYGVDTVVGRLPGGDMVSGAFSTFFFIYQGGKLPKGKNLSWIDRAKIFGLQAVDTLGKPVGKIASAVYLAAQGAILGMALGPIGAVVGGVAGGVGGYVVGGVLFDYFFKANKWSAQIFDKHCKTLALEAQKEGMTATEIAQLEKDQAVLKDKFSKTKSTVDKVADKTAKMYKTGKDNYTKYKEKTGNTAA